jgi:hypothetical protein
MELLFTLIIVGFFIAMNNIKIALLDSENRSSEIFIALSTLLFKFLYSLIV